MICHSLSRSDVRSTRWVGLFLYASLVLGFFWPTASWASEFQDLSQAAAPTAAAPTAAATTAAKDANAVVDIDRTRQASQQATSAIATTLVVNGQAGEGQAGEGQAGEGQAAEGQADLSPDETAEVEKEEEWTPPWQSQNPVFLFGLVMAILGLVFWTSSLESPGWKQFYSYVPMLLLCYFLPSLLKMSGLASKEAAESLYWVASRFLLPACLVLLTMCVDLREIIKLGPKALIMFLAGTVGVILGGPIAVGLTVLVAPGFLSVDGADATWRGLSTVAGSWIGGGANQTAMKIIFEPTFQLYSQMVAVDVIVAELWMAVLLIGIGHTKRIDRFLKADSSSIDALKNKMEAYANKNARIPTTSELMIIAAIGLGVTGVSHWLGVELARWFDPYEWAAKLSFNKDFFWLVLLVTVAGLGLSFTPARKLDGAGASKVATVFIFILVGTIGLQMDLWALLKNPWIFLVGILWMMIHVAIMFVTAYLIRAPYFFIAVGSKANIGGAASAPVVASAFHPSLAPVGVLLAVLGYVLGTFGAYLSALMMQAVSEWGAGV